MKKIRVECPDCGYVWKLFLCSNPNIIILTCPYCQNTLLHYHRKTFQLTRSQIKEIRAHVNTPSMMHVLNRIIRHEKDHPVNTLPAEIPERSHQAVLAPSHTLQSRSGPNNARVHQDSTITRDDIVNLKIDLALSRTSEELIDRLC